MIVLDVKLNGEQLAVAGQNDLSTLCTSLRVYGVLGPESNGIGRYRDGYSVFLSTSGITSKREGEEKQFLTWLDRSEVPALGDTVSIRLLDSMEVDAPLTEESADCDWTQDVVTQSKGLPKETITSFDKCQRKFIAMEVKSNGKRVSVAGGRDFAMLVAKITGSGVLGPESSGLGESKDRYSLSLAVMGIIGREKSDHVMFTFQKLKIGDNVTVKLIETEEADLPADKWA